MVNMLYLNHHAENGFERISTSAKKFEDKKLEEFIGQDQCQTLQELSESLNVDSG